VNGRLNIVQANQNTFFEIPNSTSVKSNILPLNLQDFLRDQAVNEALEGKEITSFLVVAKNEVNGKVKDTCIMITLSKKRMLTYPLCRVPNTTSDVFLQIRRQRVYINDAFSIDLKDMSRYLLSLLLLEHGHPKIVN
jgi:hypothetical protein